MKKYKIASVCLDENGMYWVEYLGDIPGQGGLHWGTDCIGFPDGSDDAVEFLRDTLTYHHDEYLNKIKEFEDG